MPLRKEDDGTATYRRLWIGMTSPRSKKGGAHGRGRHTEYRKTWHKLSGPLRLK
jgi:hypothetical protein